MVLHCTNGVREGSRAGPRGGCCPPRGCRERREAPLPPDAVCAYAPSVPSGLPRGGCGITGARHSIAIGEHEGRRDRDRGGEPVDDPRSRRIAGVVRPRCRTLPRNTVTSGAVWAAQDLCRLGGKVDRAAASPRSPAGWARGGRSWPASSPAAPAPPCVEPADAVVRAALREGREPPLLPKTAMSRPLPS